MGRLLDGTWRTDDFLARKGAFKRGVTTFRSAIEPGGQHPPESGRYHLYVSYACPWAHRTLIARALKGLESHISVSVVSPLMGNDGWTFAEDFDGATQDHVLGKTLLRDVYTAADPAITTRVTVPILFDTQINTIVNNESEEILRIFDRNMGPLAHSDITLRPASLAPVIDPINDRIYNTLNNGVYKCGFAGSQSAYDQAVHELFDTLDWLEDHLATRRFLAGDRMTEADIRLFVTLIRFDPVYVGHFRCNRQQIGQYNHLSHYLRELYQVPAFRDTTFLDHIRHHYYRSHESIHPSRIVPIGPRVDLSPTTQRAALGPWGPVESLRQGS